MITGFNTDVDHRERVFHVQTEDKGVRNPVVESLIYVGGEILTSRQSSYEDLVDSENYSENEVMHRMEAQHQALIRDIFNGKFDDEEPKPFGHAILTNRSLDEVVLDYLQETFPVESIRLVLDGEQELTQGSQPTLKLQVLGEATDTPYAGAPVRVTLISPIADPLEVYTGATDSEGWVEACFEIPKLTEVDAAIVCGAEVAGERAELRQMIKRARRRKRG